MKGQCRVGVIGVGHLGSIHARLLSQIESADLVGIYDLAADQADRIAGELSIRPFGSSAELLSEELD